MHTTVNSYLTNKEKNCDLLFNPKPNLIPLPSAMVARVGKIPPVREKAFSIIEFAKRDSVVIVQRDIHTGYNKEPPQHKPV
jgi:hypothetical protein